MPSTSDSCPPAPRNRHVSWLIPLLLAILFFAPAIIQGKTFYAFDTLRIYSPWKLASSMQKPNNKLIMDPICQFYLEHLYYRQHITQGQFPLWNPLNFSGRPSTLYLNPLMYLLFGLLPVTWAHDLLLFLCMTGTGLCMYAFLRELECGKIAALIGAASWMFNGYVMVWFEFENTPMMALSIAALLLALERWLKRRDRMAFLWLVLAIAFSISCNYVHLLVYTCLLAGGYTLYRWFQLRRGATGANYRTSLGGALLAFLAGVVICTSLFTNSLAEYQDSQREHFPFSRLYQRTGRLHADYLATLLYPDLYGNPAQTISFPPKSKHQEPYNNFNELCVYGGIMPLLLALTSLAFMRRTGVIFFFASGLVALSMAMGSRLYYPLATLIPGLDISTPTRVLFIFGFALSTLAGLGANGLMRLEQGHKKKLILLIWVMIVAAAIIVLLRMQADGNIGQLADRLSWMKQEIVVPFLQAHFSFSNRSNIRSLLFLAAGLSLLCALLFTRTPKQRTQIACIILLLVFLDLSQFGLNYNTTTFRKAAYPTTPGIDYLQSDPSKFRVLYLGRFSYNWLAPFGIDDICGYRSFYSRRYRQYIALSQRDKLPERLTQWLVCRDFGSPLLDLLNVKYVLLPSSLAYTNSKLRLAYYGGMNIYRNTAAFPRAFFVTRYLVRASEQELWNTLKHSSGKELRSRVLLEHEPQQKFKPSGAPDKQAATASITAYSANRIELSVTNSEPGFLVMSDSYSPYWQARVNGTLVEVLRANGIMRAVPLPAGEHRVVMQYRPWPVIIGLAISACGWLALFLAIAYHLLSSRRKWMQVFN